MAGNTFGDLFAVTTFGESHGRSLGCVVDGCPPGLELSEEDLLADLCRRRPGASRHVTQRREDDMPAILSGVFEGKTTGTPIAIEIQNTDMRSRDYNDVKDVFRPGHADYGYAKKYGLRDYRGGGRSSARETAARVAAGAIAKKWLRQRHGTEIRSCLTSIGPIDVRFDSFDFCPLNPFNCPNEDQVEQIEAYLDSVRAQRDSVGAGLAVVATGVPAGLGSPVFDKLDARLAYALMGVNAVKSVEIGDGKEAARALGSANNDAMRQSGFLSNHAGGILGGISTGQDVIARVAVKPTPSIPQEQLTVGEDGKERTVCVKGRHDPCVGLRAGVILEAMVALTLIDEALKQIALAREPS